MRKRLHELRINRKGLSTILASLLLVVIVVIASVIVYAWSTGLIGSLLVGTPSVKEAVSMDSYTCSSASVGSCTLQLRNVGTTSITLQSAYINGAPWTGFSSTSISVNTVSAVPVTISGATAGLSYEIKLVTVRGTQFTFNVVA